MMCYPILAINEWPYIKGGIPTDMARDGDIWCVTDPIMALPSTALRPVRMPTIALDEPVIVVWFPIAFYQKQRVHVRTWEG